jgi:hypothetical protein
MKGAEDAVREYFERNGGKRGELQVRLTALDRRISRDRRLTTTTVKGLLRDLVGNRSVFPLNKRTKEILHRDIAEITSFQKAHDFVARVLENLDQLVERSAELTVRKGTVRRGQTTHGE